MSDDIILEVDDLSDNTVIEADSPDSVQFDITEQIVIGGGGRMQTKSVSYTPTESEQTEQLTPSAGYDGFDKVNVSVGAMPSGTAGTPTATKGTVSNHSVSVTPSVTNTTGYITGGTKTGTAVTVSASELDSGTKSITSNGNAQDVVGYAAVNVAVPNSYSAADEGKVVDNGALVSQTSDTVTANDTYDTTLINSLTVNVSGGGTPATAVTVETLPNGADHYIINGVDISDTTAVAADVASGKYFYTAAGVKTAGTASGGVTYSSVSVTFKNGRSGTIALNHIMYVAETGISAYNGNIAAGATSNRSDCLTDGEHIWFRPSAGSNVTYNGDTVDFVRSSQNFRVTLPDNYADTIPLVIT